MCMGREIVITGLGAVSGLGIGLDALWNGLDAGESALRPIEAFDASGFGCGIGAEVPDIDIRSTVPKSYRKATKVMCRDIELAVVAAHLAVEDAGLVTRASDGEAPQTYPSPRMGCHIGACLIAADLRELTAALATARTPNGNLEAGGFDIRAWGEGAINNLTPLWLLKYLPNMLACHVTILHGAEGPSNTITCAEASGLLSIGESIRVIERGDADLCFSGGADSSITELALLRASMIGFLAGADEWRKSPGVRPFDATSPGGVVGEGGGILVLEEAGAAEARGARAYARVLGHGSAQSTPPMPLPCEPDRVEQASEGLSWAIEAALRDANLAPGDIDAIVPLGTGVPLVDALEQRAIERVFGDDQAPIVTLCQGIGTTGVAAGALQASVAARALHSGVIPVKALARGSISGQVSRMLVCTPSKGGQSAALVLGAMQ